VVGRQQSLSSSINWTASKIADAHNALYSKVRAAGAFFEYASVMTDIQTFTTTITGSIQAAKSTASSPEFAQPEFFKMNLQSYFDMIHNEWDSRAKAYLSAVHQPSLEELSAALNDDIRCTATDIDRCMVYQLLLRLTIVIYGMESNMLRSTSRTSGVVM
jgi:hypothetical protein